MITASPKQQSPPATTPTPTLVKKQPKPTPHHAILCSPGEFESEKHYYPRVLNSHIHPLVSSFFNLGNERIMARYTHLNPQVDVEVLREVLEFSPKYFQWAGSDLFNVTTASGQRQMIIVETNSCPSGQKSMPLLQENDDLGGYRTIIENSFNALLSSSTITKEDGALAVLSDKNPMEATGYAAALAEISGEKVWYCEWFDGDENPPVKWVDGWMYVQDAVGGWNKIRACFRYVTQRPWNRFPVNTKTMVLNSIVACLAGGRNKMMAARAYEFLNSEIVDSGLAIRIPDTIRNVSLSEIPLLLDSMGGFGVIKVPYSNAGQGVYTITNKKELEAFMSVEHYYDKFIVQALVGNASWSSTTRAGQFYHVGTMPNKRVQSFVSDLRMMVSGNREGFSPVACYARRARKPLLKKLGDDLSVTSWEMLGTNLSVLDQTNKTWSTESQRLLLMDRKDFNNLGIGIDDLIDAYIQTVLTVVAIDKMCGRLVKEGGEFDVELFEALNPDPAFCKEILGGFK